MKSMISIKFLTVLLCAGLFLASAVFFAHAEDGRVFTEDEKEQIGEVIRDYLDRNPELVIQAIDNYRAREEQRQAEQAAKAIEQYKDVFSAKDRPIAGNPEGDVTVVEFFDYNCGYCKRALEDIVKTLETDENVRFLFIDMPILSPESHMAAKWALAAFLQGQYFEYHKALMEHSGPKSPAALEKIAAGLGLDVERMKSDAADREVQEMLEKNLSVAQEIGIRGTPAFIVNGQLYKGYMGEAGMTSVIKMARDGKTPENQ